MKRRARGSGRPSRRPETRRASGVFLEYVSARLYGDNPRLTLKVDGKRVAMLKVEPAIGVRHYTSRRGEKVAVDGVVGAALVVEDPHDLLEVDENGRLRLRVMSPAELRRFALRLLEYADVLDVANMVGVDARAAAGAWFNGHARGGVDEAGDGEEGEEVDVDGEAEEGFEEVDVA